MTETKIQPAPALMVFGWRFPDGFLAFLLALMTLALFWPATHCGFIQLDDTQYVRDNPYVQQGLTLDGIIWALTHPIIANWHPVTMWSYMLDREFFGMNPAGFHLTNIVLHAVNTALLFLVLFRFTGARGRSWLVAALFGLHPLHVESVAWVAERKDVLSTLFWLLTMWAYAQYAECAATRKPETARWYGLALAGCALGLMSKTMLVTLPCVLLLLDFWPLARFQTVAVKRLVLEKIPFFILAAAASAVIFLLQKQGGAMMFVKDIPLSDRIANALVSYCRYLENFFWPENLAIYYPHPPSWPSWQVSLAALFLGAVSLFVFLRRQRQPFMLTGWFWFVGTLVPVIGLVQVGGQAMADRYTYVPSIGFFILVVWGAYGLIKNCRHQFAVSVVAGTAVLVFCGVKTWRQIPFWQDTETVSRHALAVTRDNYMAHDMLGGYLGNQGRIDEAISNFQAAIRLKPDFVDAICNLGIAYSTQSRTDDAIREFQESIRLMPGYAAGHYNLGLMYFNKGRIVEAMSEYKEAVRLDPQYASGFNNFCSILDLNNLAWALATSPDAASRNGPRAVEIAEDACQKTQYRVTIIVGTLAAAYAEAGRFDDAVATGQKACALAAEFGDAGHLEINRKLVSIYQSHRAYHESPPVLNAAPPN